MALVESAARDLYAVLGVPRDADDVAIKRAFRARARECHPDVAELPGAAARLRELANAYDVLSSPQSRDAYDRALARGPTFDLALAHDDARLVRYGAAAGVIVALAFLALLLFG
jgi:curved DNA-binding protein CbpA